MHRLFEVDLLISVTVELAVVCGLVGRSQHKRGILVGREDVVTGKHRIVAAIEIKCVVVGAEMERFEPGEPFETYLRAVALGPQVERLPEAERAAYVHAVAEAIGDPVVDYVRLNISARRALGTS